jgi:hypothetical protein
MPMRVALMVTATLAATCAAPAPPAYAASYVDCSSSGYSRSYCPINTNGGVSLDRQYSGGGKGACNEGDTWGYDRRGIWVDRGCRARFRVGDNYGGGDHHGGKDKDNTAAVAGGLLIGALLVGAIAASNKKDKDADQSAYGGDSRDAVDSCSNEAMNQASRYGDRPRIDRITYVRPGGRGYSVQGYVSADAGPRSVSYSFQCDFDGRYARVSLN